MTVFGVMSRILLAMSAFSMLLFATDGTKLAFLLLIPITMSMSAISYDSMKKKAKQD